MKRVIYTFNKIQNKQPYLGSFCILAKTITDRRFKYDSIARMFTKMVPKDEYVKKERRCLIQYLYTISNPLLDNELEIINDL